MVFQERALFAKEELSPLLFVLGTDLLQSIINEAYRKGLLSMPVPTTDNDFPIIQYADDIVLFVKAFGKELFCLKTLLNTFTLPQD